MFSLSARSYGSANADWLEPLIRYFNLCALFSGCAEFLLRNSLMKPLNGLTVRCDATLCSVTTWYVFSLYLSGRTFAKEPLHPIIFSSIVEPKTVTIRNLHFFTRLFISGWSSFVLSSKNPRRLKYNYLNLKFVNATWFSVWKTYLQYFESRS